MKEFIAKVITGLTVWYEMADRKIILPFYQKIIYFLNVKSEKKIKKYGLMSNWKEKSLQDFRLWLSDIPENNEEISHYNEACDLYTLLSEFSGLRQEIRLQNREQSKSVKTVNSIVDSFQESFRILTQNSKEIKDLKTSLAKDAEKKVISNFFDLKDNLLRGLAAVKKTRKNKGIWGRGKVELDTIIEGYEIAIRKFDRAMDLSGITAVDTKGKKFDPKTMKAVSVRDDSKKIKDSETKSGYVIHQVSAGFLRNNEVLKYAEVVVLK